MLHLLSFLLMGVVILKTQRKSCSCGKELSRKVRNGIDGEGTDISLYTRNGIIQAKHHEYRCKGSSRPKTENCKLGHYYGYHTSAAGIHYHDDALAREYLITSRCTG